MITRSVGFHDICLTVLLAIGKDRALPVCRKMASLGIFHHFLTEPLEVVAPSYLRLMYVIMRNVDKELEAFLRNAQLGTIFALSWLLTWFAHSIDSYEAITRLYDFFIATHPLMPVYFATALVLYRSAEILERCECDMASIHMLLNRYSISSFV